MHLVYHIDLVTSFVGPKPDPLPQCAHVVHTGVGGRINLDQVEQPPLVDCLAYRTLVAGALLLWSQTVDRFGQQAGHGRLAGSTGTGKEISVMDAPRGERIAQRTDDVLLSHYLVERSGSPFAIQRLHCHHCLLSNSPDSLTPSGEKGKSVVQDPLLDYNVVVKSDSIRVKANSRPQIISLSSPDWEEYELLDSGNELKLERFGPHLLIRPEPRATWRPALPTRTWESAHAVFQPTSKDGSGQWRLRRPIDSPWTMRYKSLMFQAQVTDSRHIGVFPENGTHWDWIMGQIETAQRPIRVLNLFAYTGLATLAAAQAGAQVTHVDASRKAVKIARENQALSGMKDHPIRWIVDDALEFVRREQKRGVKYEGIIMDPPKFGRGPKGQVWEFSKLFSILCQACRAILSARPLFVVTTTYTGRTWPMTLYHTTGEMMAEFGGTITVGELVTMEQSAGRVIPNATFARWVSCE